jgi:putative ABC transport system permease protein
VNVNSEKWLGKTLSVFCPRELIEEIEGDLLQRYQKDIAKYGNRKAKRKLLWNTIRFLRLEIILRNKISIKRNHMIRNYVKIAFRNILKQKSYTILNILGL